MLFFSSCQKTKNEWYAIPDKSSLVIKISGSNISKKIASDKLLSLEFSDLYNLSTKDTLRTKGELEQLLNSPYQNGIDIFADFYLFKIDSLIGIYIPLHDDADFSEFIENTLKKKTKEIYKYHFTHVDNSIVAWDEHTCLFLSKENSSVTPSYLENLLNLKKDNTIFNNEKFKLNKSSTSDVALWFKAGDLLKQYSSSFLPENIFNQEYSYATINFDQGKISIKVEEIFSKYSSKLLTNNSHKIIAAFTPTSALNIDVNYLIEFIQKDSSEVLQHLELTKDKLKKSFTGKILFNLSGIEQQEKTFTTYNYDEDFNKIEITETKKSYYPILSLLIQSNDIGYSEKILNKLSEKNLIEKKDNYHYESIYTGSTFYIDNSPEGIYLNTNKKEIPATTAPEYTNKSLRDPFYISIAPKNFRGLFTEVGFNKRLVSSMETMWIIASKEEDELSVRSEISFADKDQNSLSSILEVVKRKHR